MMNIPTNTPISSTVIDAIQMLNEYKLNKLKKRYNTALIESGYGISWRELKQKNRIDMRNILTYDNNSPTKMPQLKRSNEEKQYVINNDWYSAIPCISEGILRVNTGRYIYFNIQNIDIENRQYTVDLQDYFFDSNTGLRPGVQCTVINCFSENNKPIKHHEIKQLFKSQTNWSDINSKIDINTLNFSETEKELWQYHNNLGKKEEKIMTDKNTTPCKELGKFFIYLISKVNYILSNNKPIAVRNKKKTKQKIDTCSNLQQPKKIIRNVGNITIISEKIPRLPTKETIIRYKCANWVCRGHIRHYKDGRTVYIKPSIHHRKCLNDTTNIPQTIINIKGE